MRTGVPNTCAPLDTEELAALRGALRRLHVELRAFLAALPASAQTASGLSRFLDLERTTCQRAVHAAVHASADVSLARQLPGARGLRMLVEAAAERAAGSDKTLRQAIGTLREAIEKYEEMTHSLANSRSMLLRRIAALQQGAEIESLGEDEARLRQMLFSAAAGLTGRHSDTWLAIHTYEPIADKPGRISTTRAHGLIGHVASEEAVPLTFHVFGAPNEDEVSVFRPLTPPANDGIPAEILRDFSSHPLPIVHTKQPNEFLVQTLDADPDQSPSEPLDILFGMSGQLQHPATTESRVEDVWALVNFPVRRLLLDVFMHRDLARSCIPGLDVHLWRPDFASPQIGERWQTRFAQGPKLQVIGVGLGQADTDAYSRHQELLTYLFEKRGLVPDRYIGFRCDVAFPMWRTGYRMSFDFGDGATA